MKNYSKRLINAALLLLILLNIVSAQTFEMQSIPTDQLQFGLKFIRPNFNNEIDLSTFSGTYELSANIPVSLKWNILTKIPYISTTFTWDFGYDDYKFEEAGLGNIFIGMQFRPKIINTNNSIITFGLFLPTADEDASGMGEFADILNLQTYFSNSLTPYFNYAFHHINQNGFRFGFEIGPKIIIPTANNDYRDTELYINYGISPAYQINRVLLRAELLGSAILSEDEDEFEDRFIHSANFGIAWVENRVISKIFYKIYLKDFINDLVDGVLGIEVVVSVN